MYMYYDHGYEVGSMSLAIMTESTDDWRLFSWLNMIQLTRLPLLEAKWQQRCKDNDWKLLQKFTGLSLPQRIIVSDPYNLSCQPIKISIQPKKVLPKDEHKTSATWEKIAGTKESDEASVHQLITIDAPIEEWYCVGWRIVDACWELWLMGPTQSVQSAQHHVGTEMGILGPVTARSKGLVTERRAKYVLYGVFRYFGQILPALVHRVFFVFLLPMHRAFYRFPI